MATQIKNYKKEDGTTAYMFKKYLGIDPVTKKRKETTRRGFSTLKEAKIALAKLEIDFEENGFHLKRGSELIKRFLMNGIN